MDQSPEFRGPYSNDDETQRNTNKLSIIYSFPTCISLGDQPHKFPPTTTVPSAAGDDDEMTTIPLKAVTLTHIRYQRGDQIGHFLAWVSLIPVFITFGGFFSHFFFRREIQGICFAGGLFVSQIVNEFIKTTVSQARPATCAALEACDSHGWPSSHSQFMFFFAVYFSLLSHRKYGFFGGRQNTSTAEIVTWLLAVLTMVSRVYLGYHSVAQVFAGAFLGCVLGGAWFWVVNRVFVSYFPLIEESYLGRKYFIKDTSHIANVLKFEYDNARAARQNSVDKTS